MKTNLEFLQLAMLVIWFLIVVPFLVFNFNLKKNTGMPKLKNPPPHVDLNLDHRKRVYVNTNEPLVEKMSHSVFFLLEKHDWSKWEHVMFVEDFRSGRSNYEILRRVCKLTGLTQYRRVYVKKCVSHLTSKLTDWWSSKNNIN